MKIDYEDYYKEVMVVCSARDQSVDSEGLTH